MSKPTASSINPKPYDLEPNVEATLSYLLPPFTGIAVYIMEKENKFVRFHAMQSILLGIAAFVLSATAQALIVVLIGFILMPMVSIAVFLAWLFAMWKAYENEEYELPLIGKLAHEQVNQTK
ncbi:DUF4870 domain-containing protein [candidate division WWE3 bacterium]|jgi:uncharacterized membrane protein|nr:DUF4870 domain-containing protein [candidate division WWE3 bacterium]MBT7350212.1 DUF4870 domain-containing protein [candidate division WWE3 bacterium]